MTATNHAITGAVIATVIHNPAVALPLAFFSHFFQDALPHFGYGGNGGYRQAVKHPSLKFVMAGDVVFFMPFVIILLSHHASLWVYLAAFLALCPDFYNFIRYFFLGKGNEDKISQFLTFIQWCERPWGIIVEIAWYVAGLILLVNILP
ncbi:MAG TPA: hypothetical protein VFW90_01800 [Candidatus Saccharimonadales bacterium]|nr:hypothetical protein [Candidatus Saccharimonadales bacterium]